MEHRDAILDRGTDAQPIPPDRYPWLVQVEGCGAAFVASNVVLTAAHCVDDDQGSPQPFVGLRNLTVRAANTTHGELIEAIASLLSSERAQAYPDFTREDWARDLAVVVFPEEQAIPRRLLVPARVASLQNAVGPGSILLSTWTHRLDLQTGECLNDQRAATSLLLQDAEFDLNDDGISYWTFNYGPSRTCGGDSGSPVRSSVNDWLVGLGAGGDQSSYTKGLVWRICGRMA